MPSPGTPSSVDDVFRTGTKEEATSGRSSLVSGLFQASSPTSPVPATHSWKDKITNAISRTGLRLRASKRKNLPDDHFDVASDAPDVPPMPEFLKSMVSTCPSSTGSGNIAPGSYSPTRDRLAKFFSRASSRSPSPFGVQRENARERTSPNNATHLARPIMRERVSTIADRKITQAVPREEFEDVTSHAHGMSSHLSLHEPDFPISKHKCDVTCNHR
jgi:hypothetical protein